MKLEHKKEMELKSKVKTTKIKKQKNRLQKGITLIALVITIIVLLILAGVSIATLTGDNGILTKAQTAKEETQKASVIEMIQTDILEMGGDISCEEIKNILSRYFDNVPDEDELIRNGSKLILKTKKDYGEQEIKIEDIIGKIPIEKTKSYVGYYADIDADGEIDGIIYADLGIGLENGKGEWFETENVDVWKEEHGEYSYNAITGIRNYYVSRNDYEGKFGKKDVLSPIGTGNNRFYVMALDDFKKIGDRQEEEKLFDWYYAGYWNFMDWDKVTAVDFGTGKKNTDIMVEKWNKSSYGEQDKGLKQEDEKYKHQDLWGVIQDKVKEGWFVPSRGEWSAFAGNLEITTENYQEKGLESYYLTSSLTNNYRSFLIYFPDGAMGTASVKDSNFVRMSIMF